MSRALKQTLHVRGADARLQLRDALASLGVKELQAQSVWTVEHLLERAEPQQVEGFLRDVFHGLKDCHPTVRRLRYKLGATALKLHAGKHLGQTLLLVRDKVIERVGHEESAETAAELRGVMFQLAAACVEAYCNGHYSSLGVAGKEELPRVWLCDLLILPLLRAACRGPAKTKLANGCLLVDGVLALFKKWAKSAAVLHSATECLKEMLRLAGAVPLAAGEVFLPIQSCVSLLGARLTATAVHSILRVVVAGMAQQKEWQVRKAATDTLAMLVPAVLQQEGETSAGAPRAPAGSGLAAMVAAQPEVLVAVEQHVKFDRIPQVRQAAVALWQELLRLGPTSQRPGAQAMHGAPQEEGQGPQEEQQQASAQPAQPGYAQRHVTRRRQGLGRDRQLPSIPPACAPAIRQQSSPPRFVKPQIPAQHRSSLDFGVQVFAPTESQQAAAHRDVAVEAARAQVGPSARQGQQEAAVLPLPATAREVLEAPACQRNSDALPPQLSAEPHSGRTSAQAAVHYVMHPLFSLQLQADPPMVSVRAAGANEGSSSAVSRALAGVDVRLGEAGHPPACPRMEVEVWMQPDRPGGSATAYSCTMHEGSLFQRPPSSAASNAPTAAGAELCHASLQPPPAGPPAAAPGSALLESKSAVGSPVLLSKLATTGLPSFSPRAAGRSTLDIGMGSPAKRWAESLRMLDAPAPLLPQPPEPSGSGAGSPAPSRPGSPNRRRSCSPTGWRQEEHGLGQGLPAGGSGSPRRTSAPAAWALAEPRSRSAGSSPGSPRQRYPPQQQHSDAATPASCPSSLAPPQLCESPPYAAGMQPIGSLPLEPLPAQPAKGPLTAMVTKALSRLQQLEELQDWQTSVGQQLSGGGGGVTQASQASEASSVKPAAACAGLVGGGAGAQGCGPLPAADLSGAFERVGEPADAGAPAAHARSRRPTAEPSLSAIPEASERSSSLGSAEAVAAPGGTTEGEEGEMARLLQLQQKLATSLLEVRKRIRSQSGAAVSPGAVEGGGIPAAWPQQEAVARLSADPSQRPGSRESGISSPRYLDGGSEEMGWMNHSNPLFNTSRPSTALGTQPSLGSGEMEPPLSQQQQQQQHDQRQPSLGLEVCPTLSVLSSGGSHSGRSLGSEFGRGTGRDTEEEVQQFLRGSIASPAQHDAMPHHRRCMLPSAVAAAAAASNSAVAGRPPECSNARALAPRAERPPRPPPAPNPGSATSRGDGPGLRSSTLAPLEPVQPAQPSGRRERARWLHLESQQTGWAPWQEQQQHGSVQPRSGGARSPPHAASASVRELLRASVDLDAILDSSPEPSPEASAESGRRHAHLACGSPGEERVAESGFPAAASQAPTAELQRLRVSSRPAPPGVGSSLEEAVRGSISQVLHATFPDDALERLERLRARLSPSRPTTSRHQKGSPKTVL